MEAFLMLLGGVAFVAFVLWAHRWNKRKRAEIDGVWCAVAEELGGSFERGDSGFFARQPRRLEATVDGVAVKVDHYTEGRRNSSTTYTRLKAEATSPAGLRLSVYREHALSGLARALGFQDVRVGDRRFDRAFVVKCNKPELARPWLNAPVRKRLGRTLAYRFELENGQVSAVRLGVEEDANNLKHAVAAVAGFADARRGIVKTWAEAARRLGGGKARIARPWARLELEVDGAAVKVTTRSYAPDDLAYTVVETVPQGARPARFALSADRSFAGEHAWIDAEGVPLPDGWALWTNSRDAVVRRLGDEMVARLVAAAPSYVLVDEALVQLRRRGIVTSSDELVRLVELALLLAAPESSGPYR